MLAIARLLNYDIILILQMSHEWYNIAGISHPLSALEPDNSYVQVG